MKRCYSEGFSSLEVLLTLFFISLVIVATSLILSTVKIFVVKKNNELEDKRRIEKKLAEVIEEIKSDQTPEIDSRIDSVWRLDDIEQDECKIQLKALSGLLNVNTVSKQIMSLPEIRKLFSDVDAPSVIENYKSEGNLYSKYEQLNELIEEENYNKYFCIYGYANINVADDYGLRNLVNNITLSNSGEYLVQKRKTLLVNKQFIQTENNFKMFAGVDYNSFIPYVNIKPEMNIHFIEEDVLRALLSYPGFKITGINQKINNILSLRESSEISQNEICNILGISKSNELYYYLGCTTWMWQIKIIGKKNKCTVILCRKPEEDEFSVKTPEYYVIEKKWYE